jgi:DNA gyrase/topoisomerase IV subunit B
VTPLICRVNFDTDTIRTRLREVAFLNRTATITFEARGASGSSKGSGSSSPSGNGNGSSDHEADVETFHFSGGIAEFVAYNNRARHAMHEPIFVSRVVRSWTAASAPQPCSCLRSAGILLWTRGWAAGA